MITTDNLKSPELNKYVGNTETLSKTLADVMESVYIYDQKTGTSVYANRSILHLLGYSEAAIKKLGKHWSPKIVHPEDLQFLVNHLSKLNELNAGERSRLTYRVKDAQGAWQIAESMGSVLSGHDEKPYLVMGITRIMSSTELHQNANDEIVHDQRCRNCSKLLGKKYNSSASVEIKCMRCGELNGLSLV